MGENYLKQVNDSSCDGGSIFVAKTISDILTELSMIHDFSKKMSKLDFYIHSFQEEMRKIHVFQRELPLSMHLLKDAIERLKKESLKWEERERVPVMEEFIPLKSESSYDEGRAKPSNISQQEAKKWMNSLHLWITPVQYEEDNKNQHSSFKSKNKEEESSESQSIFRNREGGAFSPFKKPSGVGVGVTIKEEKKAAAVVNPTVHGGGGGGLTLSIPVEADVAEPTATAAQDSIVKDAPDQGIMIKKTKLKEPHQDEQQRKQRRCWSPELHRVFIDALQQLGGAQVATPKQIREVMKVEGLTNDEVKSHLQKYRLHVRKVPDPSSAPAARMNMMGIIPWFRQDYEHGESSNRAKTNCFSPQQHLRDEYMAGGSTSAAQVGSATTTEEGESIEEADEDDQKSKSCSWKGKSAEHPF
ncbi:hypothetical protein ABFX02_08G045900 [Erythranthe guttata]